MPGDTGGVWIWASGSPLPLRILGQTRDGGSRERILWGGVPRLWGYDLGGTAVPDHFNVMVDAVVRHWISLVTGGAGGQDRWSKEVLQRDAFFYADDGLVV